MYLSAPEKLSTELIGFDILGKTKSNDVLIYKKFRFQDQVQVYDKAMQLKRNKDVTLQIDNYETVEITKLHDELFQFYTVKENKMLKLYYQRYNLDLDKKGEAKILDSTSLRLGENYSDFRILKSKNENYALFYKYEYSGGRIDKLISGVVSSEGAASAVNTINLPDDGFSPNLVHVEMADAGTPVFLFQDGNFNCNKAGDKVHYLFVMPQSSNQFARTEIKQANDSIGSCIKELNFAINNATAQIMAIGIIGDDSKDIMTGYTFMNINLSAGNMILNNTYHFSADVIKDFATMNDKNAKNTPVYQVTTIIPRNDGGALLAAEFYEKTIENYETTNYDPYYGYRTATRQIEYFEYRDILLFSLDPNGKTDWQNIVRKKQLSKEDKGVNSSFTVANCKQNLYIIFNEDISQNSNVLQYQVSFDGTLDRKSLFNPSQQEVELRVTSAKQISFNELIIPSIYKRNIAFVKVVF